MVLQPLLLSQCLRWLVQVDVPFVQTSVKKRVMYCVVDFSKEEFMFSWCVCLYVCVYVQRM